jgi:hypothetical protein
MSDKGCNIVFEPQLAIVDVTLGEKMNKTRMALIAVLTIVLSSAAEAQSYGPSDPARADTTDPNSRPSARAIHHPQATRGDRFERRSYTWNRRGAGAYASARPYITGRYGRNNSYQYQSGGTGSPVSAGSLVGSSDRADPSGPFASGPYGEGEWAPWR